MPPLSDLDPSLKNKLAAFRSEIEAQRQLPQAVLDILYAQRWFQLAVPKACGGLECSLPEIVRTFEALAAIDANIAWCVNLGAGANMFAGYFAPEVAQPIFSAPQTALAGSGSITGTAQPCEGGWRVRGRWKYASGSQHATHFTANAQLTDAAGTALEHPDARPVFLSFLFPASAVTIQPTWDATGLKGTSSHDFTVDGVFVPHAHTFSLGQPSAFAQAPLYRFPFDSLAVVNMACMQTGMAQHFLAQFQALAAVKKPYGSEKTLAQSPVVQQCLHNHVQGFTQARTQMFEQLERAWESIAAQENLAPGQQKGLHHSARQAAFSALALIDALYPLCGMAILDSGHVLNQIWRDAHTASQHFLLSPLQADAA